MRNPLLLTDFYKTIHHMAYAPNLTKLVSYWTPRMSRKEGIDKVVMFGLQGFIKDYLIEGFNEAFFDRPKEEIISEYKRIIANTMSVQASNTKHIEELHDLGYLPLEIKAVEEGTRVPIKVPMIQITNTHPDFAWLVNYIETLMSCNIWQPMTSATIGYQLRELSNEYYHKTVSETAVLEIMQEDGNPFLNRLKPNQVTLANDIKSACGDFSMRGMSSVGTSELSSAGHLLSFIGTATIPTIPYLEERYNCNIEEEEVGRGIPSTEHSVMCSYGQDELGAYSHLINEVFPTGAISIVSDTYDYWNVLTDILPQLKEDIMARDGKIIIRGDSGDPVDIICGTLIDSKKDIKKLNSIWNKGMYFEFYSIEEAKLYFSNNYKKEGRLGSTEFKAKIAGKAFRITLKDLAYDNFKLDFERCEDFTPEEKGTVEVLWDTFGGYENDKGYKVLNSHIGTIYGDGITYERAKAIYERLEAKGFAVSNCTLGIGSYTYQYNTRDTFGFALKATHSIIDGEERFIFKAPKTDTDNFKKSQKGMCIVYEDSNGNTVYKDELSISQAISYKENLLQLVFLDGKLEKETSLCDIRKRLHGKF